MTDEEIQRIALSHGFKLKEQPDGSMALNPYVFEFANTLLYTVIPKLVKANGLIENLRIENERLRSALKGLLSDTQHVEHEDCEYSPCPVRTARQILKETK